MSLKLQWRSVDTMLVLGRYSKVKELWVCLILLEEVTTKSLNSRLSGIDPASYQPLLHCPSIPYGDFTRFSMIIKNNIETVFQ